MYFKRNVLTGCFIPHKLLNRQTFSAFALDWFTFGNAYLELPRNRPGGPLTFKHSLAKYTRRGSTDLDQYWFIRRRKEEHTFKSGTVCHVLNPDINQEVYGMPEYMAALLAASPPTPLTCSVSFTTTMDRMLDALFILAPDRLTIKA